MGAMVGRRDLVRAVALAVLLAVRVASGLVAGLLAPMSARASGAPATVRFSSADGTTTLVAARTHLWPRASTTPRRSHSATRPGRFWAERGYVALVVDSFGPRGYHAGFPRGSYANRPAEVSEQTVRPLDAYGALAYLRTRSDVVGDRIGLQGWSNGAMTALVTMIEPVGGGAGAGGPVAGSSPAGGFRGAPARYPGCGMERVQGRYVPYAPVLMLLASADEEVPPARCQELAVRSQAAGGALEVVVYEGAEHSVDDPGATRQGREPNRRATEDAKLRAERFFRDRLGR